MNGFLYRGRHCIGNREAILKSKSHMKDFCSDDTEKSPPLQTHSLREFEQHLNDLKKENFSLKLRIYFLEERIQQKFEYNSSEDVHRKNIELKVELESLKQELQERQQQFNKDLSTADDVSDGNEAKVQHCCEISQLEISHIQEVLETKNQLLQEDDKLAQSEADKMATLAASESQLCVALKKRMSEEYEVAEKNCSRQFQQEILTEQARLIEKLSESLCSKENEVAFLNEEKSSLTEKVAQLEQEMQVLNMSIQQKEKDLKILHKELDFGKNLKQLEMQRLIGEQQSQLVQYEDAAGQCVNELQKSQQQVQMLQTKIRASEDNNKELQQRLGEMDYELQSVKDAAQRQEKTIQILSSSLNLKDSEVADLQQLLEEQRKLLVSLKQQNLQDQQQQLQVTEKTSGQLHAELLELQASFFSTQLELQSIQSAQRQAQRREDELLCTNQHLLTDLQGELHHRQEAEKHILDLLSALQRTRADLANMEEKWKEAVEDKKQVVEEKDRNVRELKISLQQKERLIHDYVELLDEKKEPGGIRDVLIHKLRLRIQDRDRALEREVDERFVCVEQKEAEMRKLQLLLREKEQDLQKLRYVLSNNEETITNLEVLGRAKALELEQMNEAWKGSQRIWDEREAQNACSLRQRDALISQLQTVLHTRTKETAELTSALVSKVPLGSHKVVEELRAQLQLKEQLFQELLAERNRQVQEHHIYTQELLSISLSREQYIKDSAKRTDQVVAEQAARLQELRRQVVSERSRSQRTSEPSKDVQYLKEELQLVLAKEREAQRELSILRSTLARNEKQLQAQALHLNDKLQITAECPASMKHVAILQGDTGGKEDDRGSKFADSTEEEELCNETEKTDNSQFNLNQAKQESKGLQEGLMVSKKSNTSMQAQTSPIKQHRELPTKPSVQQDSKQVQVDQQDLGYETCGRSENELERDDTSSPEFDDLELCTSLSCRDGATQWWSSMGPVIRAEGDVTSLQQQVEDLQLQLTHSQALVQSVQDPSPQNVDRADRNLRELVMRVSSLEEQLRKGKDHNEEEGKNSTWSGKFDTLIQAQARELSHLRQRMREGRSVCHILTQHLGDTTKAFEELLRANDIDYYMGQSFRDQLAQSSALAQRVGAKISSHYSEVPDDKTGHELLAIRLSKELQQKDKLIESLRSKLKQQPRPDTPTSNHALSEATDQSEHASIVMDEQGSTYEELELGLELDTVSNFDQEEANENRTAGSHCNHRPSSIDPSIPPSLTSSDGHQSSSSCPSMHCTSQRHIDYAEKGLSSAPFSQMPHCASAQMAFPPFDPHTQNLRPRYSATGGFSLAEVHQELQMLQRQLGNSFSGPQFKLPSDFQLGSSLQTNLSDLHQLSQNAFQQSPLTSLQAGPTLKSGTDLLENRTWWNMTYGAQPRREGVYGDVSSSLPGFQSAARQPGSDLMEEHLREVRNLRQHLEDSIQTNERLRQQLEKKMGFLSTDAGAPTNIYIQGLDSVSKLSNENQVLKSELQQTSREVEQLQKAVLLERSRLKQAELDVEMWAGQFRKLQVQIRELKQDKQISQENANRLQHDIIILQQQLSESKRLVNMLQCKLQACQRMSGAATESDLQEPQFQMRLLEQQLHDKLDCNMANISTRKKLCHDSSHSPPVRDTGFFNQTLSILAEPDNLQSSVRKLPKSSPGNEEGEIASGLYACRTGSHVVACWDDFRILQQQLLESKLIACKMEVALQTSVEVNLNEGCVRNLLFSTKTLVQILKKAGSVLKMFWSADLPFTQAQTQQLQQEHSLKEEVVCLRNKLSEQEQTLRDTVKTLRDSNRTKDSMEHLILNQLSRTRDVLKKARTNLEKNELRISSLGCVFSPPTSQSFSSTSHPPARGEVTSHKQGIMTVPGQCHDTSMCESWTAPNFRTQNPEQMFSGGALSTFSTAVPPLC